MGQGGEARRDRSGLVRSGLDTIDSLFERFRHQRGLLCWLGFEQVGQLIDPPLLEGLLIEGASQLLGQGTNILLTQRDADFAQTIAVLNRLDDAIVVIAHKNLQRACLFLFWLFAQFLDRSSSFFVVGGAAFGHGHTAAVVLLVYAIVD